MALSVSVAAGKSQHLYLGNYFRHRHYDDLHRRWRNQSSCLDRRDPGRADVQLGYLRDFSAAPEHSRRIRNREGEPGRTRQRETFSNRMEFGIAIRASFESDAGRTVYYFRSVHRLDFVDDGNAWNRSGHGAKDVDRARSQKISPLADSERRHGSANCRSVSDRGNSAVGLL